MQGGPIVLSALRGDRKARPHGERRPRQRRGRYMSDSFGADGGAARDRRRCSR